MSAYCKGYDIFRKIRWHRRFCTCPYDRKDRCFVLYSHPAPRAQRFLDEKNIFVQKGIAMKRFLSILLALMLLCGTALSFVSCGDSAGTGGKVKIAIVQPMDHTSLNQIRDKIIETLKDLGYTDDKAEIIIKNASNDMSILPAIYDDLLSQNVDIVIPIATGTAQVAASKLDKTPIVFAAASDPIGAGLVTAFDKTDKNITGVSDAVDVDAILDLALELVPEIKTFGFLYNASETNSVSKIERAKAYCDAHGLSYKEATVTSSADMQQALASIAESVDAFFTGDDNTVASAMNVYASFQSEYKAPIFTGADSMVTDGGFATIGINYDILAEQTAKMADRILKGGKISDNPVETVANPSKIINKKVAEELNITIPEDLLSSFTIIE